MPEIPQRISLVRQTVDILLAEITKGTWSEWLPTERELTLSLQVSRNTLRAALKELAKTAIIKTHHGAGHRILSTPHQPRLSTKNCSVGLLAPSPLQTLRPHQAVWIDQLRTALIEKGLHLHLHHASAKTRSQSPAALKRLVTQRAYDCWVLALCPGNVQHWFARNKVPAVVAGSTTTGMSLPSVDIDHRSLCRHAAGILLSHGHRQVVFLNRKPIYAGDLESEIGFKEGIALSRQQDAHAQIIRHDGTPTGVIRSLQRLMGISPTAMLIAGSYHYLTASSLLGRLGLRIPEDISLISRDDDTFLGHLTPAPARYATDPSLYARRLFELILAARDRRSDISNILLQPGFIKGESVLRLK